MSVIDPADREDWEILGSKQLFECIFWDNAYPLGSQIEHLCGQDGTFRFGVIGLYGRDWDRLERKLLFETFKEILSCVALPALLLLLVRTDADCRKTAEKIAGWLGERGQTLKVAYLSEKRHLTEARQIRAIFESAAAEMFFHSGMECLPLGELPPAAKAKEPPEEELRRLRQLRRDIITGLVRGEGGYVRERLDEYFRISARCGPAFFREQCAGLYFQIDGELAVSEGAHDAHFEKLRRSGKTVFQLMDEANNAGELMDHVVWYTDQLLSWYRPLRANTSCRVAAFVEEYIRGHYMEPVVIEDIAAGVGLSANYVRSIFKNSRRRTIQSYLSEYRLEMACQLLRDTPDTVGKIGQAVGYNNVSYFCASFQKRYGKTPTEWRRSLEPVPE